MRRLTLALLTATLTTASPLAATDITIGTGSAPSDGIALLHSDGEPGQSFTVPRGAYKLNSITLWFKPSPYWGQWYFAEMIIHPYPDPLRDRRREVFIDAGSGRTTFTFEPVRVWPGEVFHFYVAPNWSDEGWEAAGRPYPEDFYAGLEMTSGNAYAGGMFEPWNYEEDHGWDIRFEATFTATPEPVSMALLGTGLVGIAGAARRRRQRQAAE